MLCNNTFCGLLPRVFIQYQVCLCTGWPSLLLFSCSSSLSLLFGVNISWKEVKYLGWSFDGAGNRTLDHWPPHPRPKDETTQQHPGLPPELLPRTGLWQSLPFRTQSITAQKEISPLFCHPPSSHIQPEELVLTKFRRRELHWVNMGSRRN